MKVIIIDGPDNTGKNTIIHDIIDNNDSVKVIHCHKPDDGSLYPLRDMYSVYSRYARDTVQEYYNGETDAVVFNRYYIGEWVYGQMYRDENPDGIKWLIRSIEDSLLKSIDHHDIYYIQLMSTSAELLKNNEDGKSQSAFDIDKINRELSMFKEAYDMSSLKKKLVYINDGDRFRPKSEILSEVNRFIN